MEERVSGTGTGGAASGAAAVVRGEVQSADGQPVAGARVAITSSPVPVPEIAAETDASGSFRFTAPAPGEYGFEAHADDVEGPATGTVHVPAPPGWVGAASHAAEARAADDDADVGSDEPLPEAAPSTPAPEVHVVLTLPSSP